MTVEKWVYGALYLVVGAFVVYVLIQAFCEAEPGFCQYGWTLWAAYIAGAVLFLKQGLSRRK